MSGMFLSDREACTRTEHKVGSQIPYRPGSFRISCSLNVSLDARNKLHMKITSVDLAPNILHLEMNIAGQIGSHHHSQGTFVADT